MIEFPLSNVEIAAFVEAALGEDLATAGDITSAAVVPAEATLTAAMVTRQDCIVAGLPLAVALFQRMDPALDIRLLAQDGDSLVPGAVLMTITGNARAILGAERPALNALQHLSGIATLARRYADAIAGTGAKLLDTRKTIPGWRKLAKYATVCGGAHNHRMGLYDAILIKDNHVAAAGGIASAIKAAQNAGHEAVEVECDTLAQVDEALAAGASRILLDNMSLADLAAAVTQAGGKVPLEASGGVRLDNIWEIAETGVDFISVGAALTLSAPAVDIGLDYQA